jgi:hypothetical protein
LIVSRNSSIRASGWSLARLPWLLLAGAGVAAAMVLFVFDPSQHPFFPVCAFHRMTGLLCPGCGSLRAMHQLLHGHLATAFRFNPLLMICLPFVGWVGLRLVTRQVKGEPAAFTFQARWIWLFLAATVVFTVWRNVPGSAFAVLPG